MCFRQFASAVVCALAVLAPAVEGLAGHKAEVVSLEIQRDALFRGNRASSLKDKTKHGARVMRMDEGSLKPTDKKMDDDADVVHQYIEHEEMAQSSPAFRAKAFSHAWGLEAEHSGDQSHWELTTEDRQHQTEFLEELNHEGSDICFKWHDLNCCRREVDGGECYDNCTWTWSETTKAGAKSPKEALVGHLLHRHGIGALLAATAGTEFEEFHHQNVIIENASGRSGYEVLTSSIENFPAVANIRELLLNMSFSGIRNLHSYDHTWSTIKGTGVMPGCGRESPQWGNPKTWGWYLSGGTSPPGNCALQAETSEKAYLLMQNNGFNGSAREEAATRSYEVESNYPVDPSSYYMDDEFHSGEHWIDNTQRQYKWYSYSTGNYHNSNCQGHVSVTTGWLLNANQSYIEGVMCWEAGGTTDIKIPISSSQEDTIDAAGEAKDEVIMQIIDADMAEKKKANMNYIIENWLTYYAGEDAAFSTTYETFKNHTFTVSSPPVGDPPDECLGFEKFEANSN